MLGGGWTSTVFLLFIMARVTSHKVNHGKVNNSVTFSTFTVLCHCHPDLVLKHFHHPKRKPPTQLIVTSCSSQPLATTHVLPVHVDLPIPDVACRWGLTVRDWTSLFSRT